VVGADGVNSTVRKLLAFPARLRVLGSAALRGTVEVACGASVSREIWGPDGRLFGMAPLPGARTYFYCTAPLGRWSAVLERTLENWIESWHTYGTEVASVVRAVTDWRAVNYDEIREVRVKRWYQPPGFLIGDAAHAMAPNWGQGANSAMVDGLVLNYLLARAHRENGTLEDVGRRYQAVRQRFVGLLQTGSRMAGRMPGWASPPVRWLRDALLGMQDRIPWSKGRTLELVAGYNPREDALLQSYHDASAV
jgi:2-polyprenyl-6-methoxyphenol hydroxylase-like FAD-dependent oxidoreductase